eukprot:1197676-Prymnesium_polylepis.1
MGPGRDATTSKSLGTAREGARGEEEQDDAEKMVAACSRTLVGRCPARRPGRRARLQVAGASSLLLTQRRGC